MHDAMVEFDRKDANDERSRIGEMKADAMSMIEEMPDAAFETWYTTAFQAMDEAACAQRDADELAARRFASATMYHEEACC